MINLLIKLFKKGAKSKKKSKMQESKAEETWAKIPGLFQVGVCGHASSGKTVFLTMVYEQGRNDPLFRISTLDDMTAREIHENIRLMKGLKRSEGEGSMKDIQGERRFPTPTSKETSFNFEATLNHSTRFRFTTLEYKGETISLEEDAASKKSIVDYFSECDCLLFFIDPSVIRSELLRQEQLATFVNLMERLSNGGFSINIPVGLVITKSDLIEGFEREDQVMVIRPEYHYLKTKDFESFLEGILNQPFIRNRSIWQIQIRDILRKLRPFFETLMEKTIDFQIFFVSSTGIVMEKEGEGKNLRIPPSHLKPMGIKAPLEWVGTRLILKNRIRKIRRLTRWVLTLSILWIILYTLPYLIHFQIVLPKVRRIEKETLEKYNVNPHAYLVSALIEVPAQELEKIAKGFEQYAKSRTAKWFFKEFREAGFQLQEFYTRIYTEEAENLKIREKIDYFEFYYSDTLATLKDSLKIFPSDTTEYILLIRELKRGAEKKSEQFEIFQRDLSKEPSLEDQRRIRSIERGFTEMISFCNSELTRFKRGEIEGQTKPLLEQYAKYQADYKNKLREKDYNYLLLETEFPATLKDYKKELEKYTSDALKPTINSLISKVDDYLNRATKWKKSRIYKFRVNGVPPPPQGKFVLRITSISGTLSDGKLYEIRLPVKEEEAAIEIYQVGNQKPLDARKEDGGFAILALDDQPFQMIGGHTITLDFDEAFKKELPVLR